MAANDTMELVENKIVEDASTAKEVSTEWANAILQVATDAARDPLRYVTDAIVPNGGE
jgi:hypothetical protein